MIPLSEEGLLLGVFGHVYCHLLGAVAGPLSNFSWKRSGLIEAGTFQEETKD